MTQTNNSYVLVAVLLSEMLNCSAFFLHFHASFPHGAVTGKKSAFSDELRVMRQ